MRSNLIFNQLKYFCLYKNRILLKLEKKIPSLFFSGESVFSRLARARNGSEIESRLRKVSFGGYKLEGSVGKESRRANKF